MAYDEYLADRIRNALKDKQVPAIEKKMFGGLCYMVDDKLCVGVMKNELIARIDPKLFEQYLTMEECTPLDKSGLSMKGFVLVDPIGVDMDEDLEKWVQLCIDFNPKAKSSKKKK